MSKLTEDIKARYMGEVLGYDYKKYREEIKEAAEEHGVIYTDDFTKYYEEDALIQDTSMMAAKPDNNNKLILGIILGTIVLGAGAYLIYKNKSKLKKMISRKKTKK